jgi:glycosyltransferase involved in cell wall biosynthesis
MKISIGILAYNEARSIGTALNSLFEQSIFYRPEEYEQIEIAIVPNGCSDDTAIVAKEILEELVREAKYPHTIRHTVREIVEPGKTNAWNCYIHQISNPQADYLLLMDADIEFLGEDTIHHTVQRLVSDPIAQIAVDTPTKDVVLKQQKNWMEKLSAAVSSAAIDNVEVWICGQFYCGRAEFLRQVWMPPGLLAEDGFLTIVARTNNLREAPILQRIARTPDAAHIFEALTNPRQLIRHEKRVVIAMTINHYLFEYLQEIFDRERGVGYTISQMNAENPAWLHRLFQDVLYRHKWWIIPPQWLLGRFDSLKYKPLPKAILLAPIVAIATLVNCFVFFQANRDMRRGKNIGYW